MSDISQSDADRHWQSIIDKANRFYKEGRYKEAVSWFQEAISEAEEFGSQDPRLATTLNNLGLVYYAQKRYEEAEPLYRRALNIREKNLGYDHPLVAASLSNLALLFYATQKYVKAESICQQSLEIREKILPADHLDLATSLNNLALIYHAMGQNEDAEPLAQRALEIRERQLPANHPLVVTSIKNLLMITRRPSAHKALNSKLRKSKTPIKHSSEITSDVPQAQSNTLAESPLATSAQLSPFAGDKPANVSTTAQIPLPVQPSLLEEAVTKEHRRLLGFVAVSPATHRFSTASYRSSKRQWMFIPDKQSHRLSR